MIRPLIPPLTIALALVTAGTLLLTAAAIAPPPLTRAVVSPPRAAVNDAMLPAASMTTLLRAPSVPLPAGTIVVTLARLTYAPDAGGPSHALLGPLLLVVEYGALTVSLDGPGQLFRPDQTLPAAGDLDLRVGDVLLLPAATAAAFHNGGPQPAVALATGVVPTTALPREPLPIGLSLGQSVRWRDAWSPGAIVQPLAGGWLVDPPPGPVAIAVGRLSLRSDGRTTLPAPGALALAVEAGALTLIAGGRGWLQHPEGRDDGLRPGADVALLPGDAVVLRDAARSTLRNDGGGPLLVLVLTVTPTTEYASPVVRNAALFRPLGFREPVSKSTAARPRRPRDRRRRGC